MMLCSHLHPKNSIVSLIHGSGCKAWLDSRVALRSSRLGLHHRDHRARRHARSQKQRALPELQAGFALS